MHLGLGLGIVGLLNTVQSAPQSESGFLLLEDATYLLLENNDKFLLEGS
jgi:hypothetical protein